MKKSSILLICIFAITSTLYFSGCKKVKHKKDVYFDITIEGNRILFVEGKKDFVTNLASGGCGSAGSGAPRDVVVETEGFIQQFRLLGTVTQEIAGVIYSKKFFNVTDFPFEEDLAETVLTSNTNFGTQCNSGFTVDNDLNYKDGFVIYYYDEDFVEWRTDYGTGNQSGNTIKLIEFIDNPNSGGFAGSKIVWLEFTCTLYDDFGNSMEVTDGNLRLLLF